MITKCSLCGFEFEKEGTAGCSRCPMGKGCDVICCPHCGYQMVDEEKFKEKFNIIRRFKKWIKTRKP